MLVYTTIQNDLEGARREAIRILCGLLTDTSGSPGSFPSIDITDDAGTILLTVSSRDCFS